MLYKGKPADSNSDTDSVELIHSPVSNSDQFSCLIRPHFQNSNDDSSNSISDISQMSLDNIKGSSLIKKINKLTDKERYSKRISPAGIRHSGEEQKSKD